nr:hypothetical transcript [Hymenolepis microstoma]
MGPGGSCKSVLIFAVLAVLYTGVLCHGPSVDHAKFYIHSVPNFTLANYTEGVFTYEKINKPNFTYFPIASISLPNLPKIGHGYSMLSVYSKRDKKHETYLLEIAGKCCHGHSHHGHSHHGHSHHGHSHHDHSHHGHSHEEQSFSMVLIYTFLGVSLTNLCSLTGVACIPIQRWRHFHYLLNFMLGLAVSALFSAAVMVLIPEALRLEEVPLEFGGQGFGYLRKMAFIPTGLYLFFIIEYILLIAPRVFKLKKAAVEPESDSDEDDKHFHAATLELRSASEQEEQPVAKTKCCPSCTLANFTEIKPVAWMILLGDSVHNFMDGVAIAAGFTQSPSIGLTLSLCVLLEELPHELGDFAVLISSGFSIKTALCVNFLSACSAYLGMIVGLVIGEGSGDGSFYVFAAMAGVFLYISLSDMLPELRKSLEKAEKQSKSSFIVFFLEFAGLMVGSICVVFVMLYSHSFMH